MTFYLKFSVSTFLLIFTAACFLIGGNFLWYPLILLGIIGTVGDWILPGHTSTKTPKHPEKVNVFLYATLPLVWLCVYVLIVRIDMQSSSVLQDFATSLSLLPVTSIGQDSTTNLIGGFLSLGLMTATTATNVAHELCHRTWHRGSQWTSLGLLAFTCDTSFAIEHVYGHHRNVATFADPASARRGENAWSFVIRSTIGAIKGAYSFEKMRLEKRNIPFLSLQNRLFHGYAICVVYALTMALIFQSWQGVAFYAVLALNGKLYLELINYIEHYGLVRIPGTPVLPKHSWNSNHAASTFILYNLTRHSHHHAKGHLAFWKLNSKINAPMLPYGYLTMMILATVPPVFKRIMAPKLREWDENFADSAERDHAKKYGYDKLALSA